MNTTLRSLLIAVVALAVSTVATLAATLATPAEKILSFKSTIVIEDDATLRVTETIRALSTGDQIKHGIYRDFPTTYKDRFGNTVRVGFSVTEVLRDGREETYRVISQGNGKRVYIGDKDVFLAPGQYTYSLTYETSRQIGFFKDFDELYWNVTGNGWSFAIDTAQATIKLPGGAEPIKFTAYTGPKGDKGEDYKVAGTNPIVFTTTKGLSPKEGLTIAVAWPKGFLTEPGAAEKTIMLLDDNRSLIMALTFLAAIAAWYLFAWMRVGRDPPAGTIIALYEPPEEFSPAAIRFITRMGFDNKGFAAAVISMAIKGYITISEDDEEFTLHRTETDADPALSKGETALARKLFDEGNSIILKNNNHSRIRGAIKSLKGSLGEEFEDTHFKNNIIHLVPGAGLTLIMIALVAFSSPDPALATFMSVWLTGWTIGCYFLVMKVSRLVLAMYNNRSAPWSVKFQATGAVIFAVPFLGGEIIGMMMFSEAASYTLGAVLIAALGINILFYYLLKAPTLHGRRILDRIDGFRMYLSVAEKDRMNMLNPPDQTPELFEKYLPYALAMGVEHEWSEQFASRLASAATGTGNSAYHPHWYHGSSWRNHGATGFADNLGGAFAGAISSSSVPPGSSSGSGGGGFSGGGGGGGGGGGW